MREIGWIEYFIRIADVVKLKSKDRSTKCGAIIVGQRHEIRSSGYNNFPRNIDDDNPEYHKRPLKYKMTEHAERNAIYNAARVGTPTDDCIMVISHNPIRGICTDCARAIIQAGIRQVIGPAKQFTGYNNDALRQDLEQGYHMLREANVMLTYDPTPGESDE